MQDLKIKLLPEVKEKLIIYIGNKVATENTLINLLSSQDSYSSEDFEKIITWVASKPWQEVSTIIEAIRVTSQKDGNTEIDDVDIKLNETSTEE